jgi:hypothetical protein
LGLLVAVLAVWFYNYFFERLEICDIEAANATSELAAYLASHRAFRSSSQHPAIAFAASKRIFDLQSLMLVAVGYFGLSLLYQMPFFLMPLTVSVLCCLPFWLARRRDSRILLLP